MNKTRFIIGMLLASLVAIMAIVGWWGNDEDSSAPRSNPTETTVATGNVSNAMWISKAKEPNELVLESDLIVRARVSEPPVSRIVRNELPVWDEKGNIVGTAVSEVLFSDTVFEVLEAYWGNPPARITVMQTGGFDPRISKSVEELADDPLYKSGEEYILFLVDISGDPVHAPNRILYRIVNPFGRYRIDGESAFVYGENSLESDRIPATLIDLEAQIEQAVREFKK